MTFRKGYQGRLLLTASLVFSLIGSSVAAAATVMVEGNSRVDADTIRSYFVGASDEGSVNKAVKDLYATGYFSSVNLVRQNGRLIVRVKENGVLINRVVFVGNSKLKADQLEGEVQARARGAYSRAVADADVQRILDIYRRSGRSAAAVTVRAVELPNGRVDVVYEINEGDKTGIKSINFVGNHVYSSGKLLSLMQTTEMNYLSFFKSSDIYDPDRLAQDQDLIRRYYLKNGYADFHIIGSDAVYDPQKQGYIITITVEEGRQYKVGSVAVDSRLPDVSGPALMPYVRVRAGDIYDGDQVEKTVDALTKEIAKKGYAFSQVRPTGDRNPAAGTVSVGFIVEEGPRVYVERINVRGNTRTQEYVIRREFEIGEGDAYNRAMIERGERRLNSLGFFKRVKITNEPGSTPDRVIVNVDVEDQSTGSFSVSGGYSTTEGFLAEVSVSESNFMGRGQYVRAAVSAGQYSRGVEFSFTEPYFLGQRLAAGFDVYSKVSDASPYAYYSNWMTGGTIRFGIPVTDDITFAPRYSIYNSTLHIPNTKSKPYNDCSSPINGVTPGTPGAPAIDTTSGTESCLANGEASLALKQSQGDWLTSMVGYTLSYNTIDNPRDPHEGWKIDFKQDFAGVGGNSRFLRTIGDIRYFHELFRDDIVGIAHLQAGHVVGLGRDRLRIVDNFNLGQSLVRGFAPSGIGPRDVTNVFSSNQGNALGGTSYYGGSLEAQFPIWGLPRDIGLKGALFADAGTLFGYKGLTNFGSYLGYAAGTSCSKMAAPVAANGVPLSQSGCIVVAGDSARIRASLGASLIWASPMGPIRFNYAFYTAHTKYDVTQLFSFSGGTSF